MSADRIDISGFEPVAPLDVGRLVWVLWYGKWLIGACVALSVWLGGYYGFHLAQPRFAATVTLRVDPQPADLRDVSEHWPAPPTDLASLNTELAILTSDRILGQVVRQEDLLGDPEFNRYLSGVSPLSLTSIRDRMRQLISGNAPVAPDADAIFDKTVSNLRASLHAQHPGDTYLLELTAQSGDADKAARLANAVAAAYVAQQISDRDAAARADIAWLGARVAALRQQLQSQETEITALRATAQVQDTGGLDQLSDAVRQLEQHKAELSATLATFAENNALSAREVATRNQLANEFAAIEAQSARLAAQLAAQSAGLATLQQTQRETEATRVLYEAFLVRLQETQVQRGLDAADARILAPATSGRYVGPRKILLVEVAALLGLLTGIGLVAVRHLTRRGVLHPQMLAGITGQPPAAMLDVVDMQAGAARTQVALRASLVLANRRTMPQVVLISGCDSTAVTALLTQGTDQNPLIVSIAPTDSQQPVGPHVTHRQLKTDELFETDLLTQRIDAWRKTHGLIAIDAGDSNTDTQAALLAAHADLCLLTVRFASTPTERISTAYAQLRAAAPTPVITVLTRVNPRKLREFKRCYGPLSAPT